MMSLDELKKGQVLLIDKPLEWTSFDVVNKIRFSILKKHKLKKFKVGHAGTLDPLASGLLIICVGKATKEIEKYQGMDKEYTGVFHLGATTPSYDMETPVDQIFPVKHIKKEDIYEAARSFLGKQMQLPPVYSAIKKGGKKMYEHARKGEKPEMEKRPVEIKEFEITGINMPEIHFRVVVSKGTYIRSLAYDFGKKLGSGAYLAELRRTKIGNFDVKDAISHSKWIEDNVG